MFNSNCVRFIAAAFLTGSLFSGFVSTSEAGKRPKPLRETIGKLSGAKGTQKLSKSRQLMFKQTLPQHYSHAVMADKNTAKQSKEFEEQVIDIFNAKGDTDDNLKNAVTDAINSSALDAKRKSEAIAQLGKLNKTVQSNEQFSKFFANLVAGKVLQRGSSGGGAGTPEVEVPRRNFSSPDGRVLQLGKHISTLLYHHAQFGGGGGGGKPVSEVQTMFLGRDIYISTNLPDGISKLRAQIKDDPNLLIGLLSERPPANEAEGKVDSQGNKLKPPLTVDDTLPKFLPTKGKFDAGMTGNFDALTRVLRFHNKLAQLGEGERQGDTADFALAAQYLDRIKQLQKADIVDVTVDHLALRNSQGGAATSSSTSSTTAAPITGLIHDDGQRRPKLFLVSNNEFTFDTAKNKMTVSVHAETGLVRVLAEVRKSQSAAEKSATPAYVAGKKRACGSCGSILMKALAEKENIRFSRHLGKIWNNQTAIHDMRTNLITALYALTAKSSQTGVEPVEGWDRERFGVDENDDDSDSRDDVEQEVEFDKAARKAAASAPSSGSSTSSTASTSATPTAAASSGVDDDNDVQENASKKRKTGSSKSPSRKRKQL